MTLFDVPKNLDALVLRANASLERVDLLVEEAILALKKVNAELDDLREKKARILKALVQDDAG